MAYSNPTTVREVTYNIGTSILNDAQVRAFLRKADSKLDVLLKKRFATPIRGNQISFDADGVRTGLKSVGKISITAGSPTITGSSTKFTRDFFEGEMLRVGLYNEALRIETIVSDTEITASSNAAFTKSDQDCYLIPDDIVTVSEYFTAKAIYLWKFSEQAYNQETTPLYKDLEKEAMIIIKKIKHNVYYDQDMLQAPTKPKIEQKAFIV